MIAATDTPQPLISMAELEQLQLQVLEQRDRCRASTSPDIGPYRSRWHGQGMEQLDTRPYHPGDDIRHIDWRATARSGRPVSKLFYAERGRKLILIIDRRKRMFFATRNEIKAATAARITAMLSFSALNAREPVTALVLDDSINVFPIMHSTDQLLPLLTTVSAAKPDQTTYQTELSIDKTIEQALSLYEPGTALCLISDFHDVENKHSALWLMLGKHFDVTAIRVIDSAEQQLQDVGLLRVRSPINGQTLIIDSSKADNRQRYAAAASQTTQQLEILFANSNIHFITLMTHDDLFSGLQSLL